MPQYLLPCSCGEKVRVEPAQAGGQIACSCGKSLIVPTLRGLRALEEAPPDATATRRGRSDHWRPIQGVLFSLGLIVAVISLAFLGYTFFMFLQASQFTRDMSPEINELEGSQIDQLGLMETYDLFVKMHNEGLGEAGIPPWVHFQHVVAEQRALMIGSGIAAAMGILAIVGSLLLPRAKQPS